MNNAANKSNISISITLLTGATGDIGTQVARLLAKQGHYLLLLSKDINSLNDLYDELSSETNVTAVPFDFLSANLDDYERLQQCIIDEFGRIDNVVHLAATWGNFAPIEHYKAQKWFEVMHVNLNATFLLMQSMLPVLKLSNKPKIIYTEHNSDKASDSFYDGALGVSNAGIKKLMTNIADENSRLMPNFRVTAVSPPPTLTKLRQKNFPGQVNSKLAKPMDSAMLYIDEIKRY